MEIVLAQPRGFCAGVVRAIEIVERALERYGAPVYVFHEIVHNRHVESGLPAYLIQDESEIDSTWLTSARRVGVTAGASTPEVLVQRVLRRLEELGATSVRELDGLRKTTTFSLPRQLRARKSAAPHREVHT